ncbi:MAG TPA: MarR family transcriptional regulator, partial [Hellea balneolensis]|nr:MarR family transcriptional regulator [Hellea balneolensis]
MQSTLPFAGQTQSNLLHILMRSGTAMSIEDIARALGVTKTAARQHILNLQQGGYVQTAEPDTDPHQRRGRPSYN